MDDALTRRYSTDDPEGFLHSAGDGLLAIDEIQRCPQLILLLKAEVDRDRGPGRFLLTGSANLLRIPDAPDSLAGRALTIRLHPFSQSESTGRHDDWVSRLLSGLQCQPSSTADSRQEPVVHAPHCTLGLVISRCRNLCQQDGRACRRRCSPPTCACEDDSAR